MLGSRIETTKITHKGAMPYATGADFCRIFARDMNRLYLLSFLLAGDRAMAEKCFVRGLDDSSKGNPVFKKWVESWARRTIIRNAIQMIRPGPADSAVSSFASERSDGDATEPAEILAVVELSSFERFVFVMSVLERYSDQECSLLLGCTRGEVTTARTRALKQIGSSAPLSRKVVSLDSDQSLTIASLCPAQSKSRAQCTG